MSNPIPSHKTPSNAGVSLDERGLKSILRRTTASLILSLGLPVLALLALVFFLLRSAAWLDHSDRVIGQANHIGKLLVSMQSSFRGFRLSNNDFFLEPYYTAAREAEQRLNDLAILVSDNPRQGANVQQIRADQKRWVAFLNQEIADVKAGNAQRDDPGFLVQGSALFDRTSRSVDLLLADEDKLRAARDHTLDRVVTALFILLALGVLGGIPALTIWIRRLLGTVASSYQASLNQTERRVKELRVTLTSIGDAVISTDAQGKVDFLNTSAETLTGYSSAEASGKDLVEIFNIYNEQTGEKAENPVAQVLRENIVVALANHTVLKARDGREWPIEDSAAPIRGEKGQTLGVILVFHEVTEKRRAQHILQASERRLRFLNQLGEETESLHDPTEIQTVSARLLAHHLAASRGLLAGLDDPDKKLATLDPESLSRLRHQRASIVLNDAKNPSTAAAQIYSPIYRENELAAILIIQHTAPRQWQPTEIALVEEVAERSWAMVEKARGNLATAERVRLSNMRADIAARLDLGAPLDLTLQGCCELLVRHLDAAFARIWTLDTATATLILRASAGIYTHLDGTHGRVPVGQFKIGRIAETRQPHLTNDVPNDPHVSDRAWAAREGMIGFAGFPLLVENHCLGVVAVFARHPISPAALHDLKPLADVIAQHIQRKAAEASLHASETLKSAILHTSLDGFILMDHEGRITDWNTAAESIFGWLRAEVVGQPLGDIIVPEKLRDAHRQGLKHYLETRQARILDRRYELPALRKADGEFPCEISITHIPQTEPPLFAGYLRDITDRKESETSLRNAIQQAEASALAASQSAERFRLLSEVVALQVWTARPDGGLDYANQECVHYFGHGEILGTAWATLVHEEDLPSSLQAWQSSLASGDPYETEFRLRHKDGAYRWFLVRARALRDQTGAISKWFGTNTDIHDLKNAQGNAERASRAKDAFLAALSHELRTPLTPVLMSAAALHEDERLPSDVRDQLGMMERNIALEARLIDDLLDLTRISRGKLRLRAEPCDAHSLISLAIEIVRDDALAKSITLQRDFLARKSGLTADPARFQQVIWNLLRNAVKFTPAGGSISIRTRDHETGRLHISVTDSGIGIDPAVLDQIFIPFEQGGLTGDHRFGGMGLGLSIARAIVDLHGGSVRAESPGTDRGATFIVELPGATEPPHGISDSTAFLPGLSGPPQPLPTAREETLSLRLLLVEDHEATLQVLSRLLTRAGHRIATANSVAHALLAAENDTFDLVISDLGLPDGTGIELMEKLRGRHGLRGIALSGYGMEEDIVRSRKAGFITHLTKPVDFNQLRRVLATFQP